MIGNKERREVSARLREHPGARLFTGEDIERLIGAKPSDFRPEDADGNYNRLADLIEPVERMCLYYDADTNHCCCYDTRLIDHDALLALADEIEDNDVSYCVSTQYVLDSYARRIREALGVEHV